MFLYICHDANSEELGNGFFGAFTDRAKLKEALAERAKITFGHMEGKGKYKNIRFQLDRGGKGAWMYNAYGDLEDGFSPKALVRTGRLLDTLFDIRIARANTVLDIAD